MQRDAEIICGGHEGWLVCLSEHHGGGHKNDYVKVKQLNIRNPIDKLSATLKVNGVWKLNDTCKTSIALHHPKDPPPAWD